MGWAKVVSEDGAVGYVSTENVHAVVQRSEEFVAILLASGSTVTVPGEAGDVLIEIQRASAAAAPPPF